MDVQFAGRGTYCNYKYILSSVIQFSSSMNRVDRHRKEAYIKKKYIKSFTIQNSPSKTTIFFFISFLLYFFNFKWNFRNLFYNEHGPEHQSTFINSWNRNVTFLLTITHIRHHRAPNIHQVPFSFINQCYIYIKWVSSVCTWCISTAFSKFFLTELKICSYFSDKLNLRSYWL